MNFLFSLIIKRGIYEIYILAAQLKKAPESKIPTLIVPFNFSNIDAEKSNEDSGNVIDTYA